MPTCTMAAILLIIALIAIVYLIVTELRQSSVMKDLENQVIAEMKTLELQLRLSRSDYEPCALINEYAGMDNPLEPGLVPFVEVVPVPQYSSVVIEAPCVDLERGQCGDAFDSFFAELYTQRQQLETVIAACDAYLGASSVEKEEEMVCEVSGNWMEPTVRWEAGKLVVNGLLILDVDQDRELFEQMEMSVCAVDYDGEELWWNATQDRNVCRMVGLDRPARGVPSKGISGMLKEVFVACWGEIRTLGRWLGAKGVCNYCGTSRGSCNVGREGLYARALRSIRVASKENRAISFNNDLISRDEIGSEMEWYGTDGRLSEEETETANWLLECGLISVPENGLFGGRREMDRMIKPVGAQSSWSCEPAKMSHKANELFGTELKARKALTRLAPNQWKETAELDKVCYEVYTETKEEAQSHYGQPFMVTCTPRTQTPGKDRKERRITERRRNGAKVKAGMSWGI